MFPHYYLGDFLGNPIYLPRKEFKYLKNKVNKDNLIYGDDSLFNPIIFNIRDLIANYFLAIDVLTNEDFIYYSNIRSKSKTIETYVNYSQIVGIVNDIKKIKLNDIERDISPEIFMKMSIGAFIVHHYPQLLTKKEQKHKIRYKNFLYNYERVEKGQLIDRSLATEKELFIL